jgi:alkyl sulfatase BDS1-like metallo-beta-lactamase superfamily hydrolase
MSHDRSSQHGDNACRDRRIGALSAGVLSAGVSTVEGRRAIDLAFDFLGVRLNGSKADGKHIVINWTFSDRNETHVMNLENAALTHRAGKPDDKADTSVTLTPPPLTRSRRGSALSPTPSRRATSSSPATRRSCASCSLCLTDFAPGFEIVEPLKASVE